MIWSVAACLSAAVNRSDCYTHTGMKMVFDLALQCLHILLSFTAGRVAAYLCF